MLSEDTIRLSIASIRICRFRIVNNVINGDEKANTKQWHRMTDAIKELKIILKDYYGKEMIDETENNI